MQYIWVIFNNEDGELVEKGFHKVEDAENYLKDVYYDYDRECFSIFEIPIV